MATPEQKLKNKILKNLPENMRMFRTNSGMAWIGEKADITKNHKLEVIRKLYKFIVSVIKSLSFILLRNPRPFHGLPEGYPDLSGWTSITITPDMVGKKIAVFTAYELKATGRLTKLQRSFKNMLESMGGIFKIIKE
jgi:hypothetical protein